MDRFGRIILREGLHFGPVLSNTLLGGEGHRPMTGSTELSVRLKGYDLLEIMTTKNNVLI